MKRILILTCFWTLLNANEHKPFFIGGMIEQLDCIHLGHITMGITGTTIHDLLYLIRQIDMIQKGIKNPQTKELVKKYTLSNQRYGLHDLALMEKQLNSGLNPLQQELLETIKDEFLGKTKVFIAQIRLLKKYVVELIDEWCERRNRADSFLLRWNSQTSNEEEEFHIHVRSFVKLDQFLSDLRLFLTDLIHSCPKAWQDFLANKDKYTTHH